MHIGICIRWATSKPKNSIRNDMEKQQKLLGLLILKMKMEKQVAHLPTEKVITSTPVQNQTALTWQRFWKNWKWSDRYFTSIGSIFLLIGSMLLYCVKSWGDVWLWCHTRYTGRSWILCCNVSTKNNSKIICLHRIWFASWITSSTNTSSI